jgi:hypothetical protein
MDQSPRKMVSPAAKGWATFFAVMFALALIPTLLSITLGYTLFSAPFYERIFEDQKLYDQFPQLMALSVSQSQNTQNQSNTSANVFAQLSTEQLNQLFSTVLPQDYLKTQIQMNLNALFDFLNFRTTDLHMVIDLQPIKQNLTGPSGQTALQELINAMPDCTDAQIKDFIQSLGEANPATMSIPMCKPPDQYLSLFTPLINSSFQQFANSMPNQIDLFGAGQPSNIQKLVESKPFQIYKFIRGILTIIPWFAIFFALTIILFTLRSLKTMLAELGVPLLISGIIGSLASVFTLFGGGVFVQSIHISGSLFDPIMIKALGGIVNQFSTFGLILCGLTFAVGLLFLLVSGTIKQ